MPLEQFTVQDLPCTKCFKSRPVSFHATSRKAFIMAVRRIMADYVCADCERGSLAGRAKFTLKPDEINASDYATRREYLDAVSESKSTGLQYSTDKARQLAL